MKFRRQQDPGSREKSFHSKLGQYQNSRIVASGTLVGYKYVLTAGQCVYSAANGIGDSGWVFGFSEDTASRTHWVLWHDGQVQDLGDFGAASINSSNRLAGP